MTIIKNCLCSVVKTGPIFWLLFFLPSGLLPAQQSSSADGQPVYELEEITVTATRMPAYTLDVPQQVTVFTAVQIQKSGATSLADLLSDFTGTVVRSYGEEGSQSSVSLRGSTQQQVLILLDGVRQNDARGGGTALQQIALGNVERVEIIHGSMSMVYGSDAVGGVINIITKKETVPGENVSLSITSGGYLPWAYTSGTGTDQQLADPDFRQLYDTQKAGLLLAGQWHDVHLRLYNIFTRADNHFLYRDEAQTLKQREHAGYLGNDTALSLYWPGPDSSLHFALSGFMYKKEVPGSLSWASTDAEQEDKRLATQLNFSKESFLGNPELNQQWKVFYSLSQTTYSDPDPVWPVDGVHTSQQLGSDIIQEYTGSDFFTLIYGGNLLVDLVESTDIDYQWRVHGGVFLVVPFYLSPYFTLQPAARLDFYSELQPVVNGSLGAVWRLAADTSFKANLATSFRAPTFNDLYWPFDGMSEGNPELEPETGYNFEVGLSRRGEKLQLDLFGFIRYTDNFILWQGEEDFVWRPSNWAALCPGLEAHLSVNLWTVMMLDFDYTLLYTFDLTGGYTLADNQRLPFIPVHDLGGGISYETSHHLISLKGKFQSRRFYGTEQYLEPYLVLNLYYQYIFDKYWTVSAALDNLLNTSYQLQPDYPMPSLAFRLGLVFKS